MTAHIVALSGGKGSTAMALRLRELEPDTEFQYVCTPTGNELPDMVNHWAKLQGLLGTRLKILTTGVSLGSLIQRWNALPNWRQRWCTRVLKIEPFRAYLASNMPAVVYVGFRADEQREGVSYGPEVEVRLPMVEWGWGMPDVLGYLQSRDALPPERSDCAACFFQTLGEWWSLWQQHPDYYAQAEAWEEQTGATFRSPARDSRPAGLKALREQFEGGYMPRVTRMADRPAMCSVCAR